MRYGKRTRNWWYALVIGVQAMTLWVMQPAWAEIESYDPRLDPNYNRATSANPTFDWSAIETLAREFQERSATVGSRPAAAGQYVQPQPWHYAGANDPIMISQAGYPGLDYRISPVGGQYSYWYGPGIYGWWQPSPRMPWWSLVSPRHHHRASAHVWFYGRHGSVMGYRGW